MCVCMYIGMHTYIDIDIGTDVEIGIDISDSGGLNKNSINKGSYHELVLGHFKFEIDC